MYMSLIHDGSVLGGSENGQWVVETITAAPAGDQQSRDDQTGEEFNGIVEGHINVVCTKVTLLIHI